MTGDASGTQPTCPLFGIGFRDELSEEIFRRRADVGFVEVIAERYWRHSRRPQDLERLGVPVIPHGVGLSIATAASWDPARLGPLRACAELFDPPYVSEHLCMVHTPGVSLGHLAPFRMGRTTLNVVCEAVDRIQEELGRPLVLETITKVVDVPGSLTASEFIRELVRRTGCGLLLDVTNVHTNCLNDGTDALAALRRLPLDAVRQVHLAGGYSTNGLLIDSHSRLVPPEVWRLFAEILPEMPKLYGALIEHDDAFGDPEAIVGQIDTGRHLVGAPHQPMNAR